MVNTITLRYYRNEKMANKVDCTNINIVMLITVPVILIIAFYCWTALIPAMQILSFFHIISCIGVCSHAFGDHTE